MSRYFVFITMFALPIFVYSAVSAEQIDNPEISWQYLVYEAGFFDPVPHFHFPVLDLLYLQWKGTDASYFTTTKQSIDLSNLTLERDHVGITVSLGFYYGDQTLELDASAISELIALLKMAKSGEIDQAKKPLVKKAGEYTCLIDVQKNKYPQGERYYFVLYVFKDLDDWKAHGLIDLRAKWTDLYEQAKTNEKIRNLINPYVDQLNEFLKAGNTTEEEKLLTDIVIKADLLEKQEKMNTGIAEINAEQDPSQKKTKMINFLNTFLCFDAYTSYTIPSAFIQKIGSVAPEQLDSWRNISSDGKIVVKVGYGLLKKFVEKTFTLNDTELEGLLNLVKDFYAAGSNLSGESRTLEVVRQHGTESGDEYNYRLTFYFNGHIFRILPIYVKGVSEQTALPSQA